MQRTGSWGHCGHDLGLGLEERSVPNRARGTGAYVTSGRNRGGPGKLERARPLHSPQHNRRVWRLRVEGLSPVYR